jgi:hypothetical protein
MEDDMVAIRIPSWKRWVLAAAVCLFGAPAAHAADQVGGHFGFVVPLVTRVNGENTTISDQFNIGFPTGITIKPGGRTAFDLELVPLIHSDTKKVDLTIHPGVLWSLSGHWTFGLRAAFEVNQKAYGFTPLINYGFPQANGTTLFAEFVLPVRFQRDAFDRGQTEVTAGIHLGWAF